MNVHIFQQNKVDCVHILMGILCMHLHKFIISIIVTNSYANNLTKAAIAISDETLSNVYPDLLLMECEW